MKIYTGTGDSGKTSLFSGERRLKNDLRIETYGSVDELSSFIGFIHSALPDSSEAVIISSELKEIQRDLFTIGALLATLPESDDAHLLKKLEDERVEWLEKRIDDMQTELEELHSFILPGGHPSAAWCHVVRTICRRSERAVVKLMCDEGICSSETIIPYLNRLSDYFFVLARFFNKITDIRETTWHG